MAQQVDGAAHSEGTARLFAAVMTLTHAEPMA